MTESLWSRIALRPQALNPRLRSKIRRSFFVYGGLLLLIGWAFAVSYIVQDRARTIGFAEEQLRAVSDSLLVQLEAMLGSGVGSAQSALVDLRERGPIATLPSQALIKELRDEVTGKYIRGLFIGDANRTIVAGEDVAEEVVGPPAWLTQIPRDGQTIVGKPILDPSQRARSVLPVARGVVDPIHGPTWVGMWFDVEELLTRYQAIGIDRGAISLVSDDGWVLAGTARPGLPPPRPTDVGDTELFRRMATLPAGRAHVLEGVSALDGKRKLFAAAKLGGDVPLILNVSRDYDAVIAPWKRNTTTVLWFSLGSSAVLILMTVLLYRFLHEINRRESQFHQLFESSLASILLLKDGRIVERNSQTRKTFRVPEEQTFIGKRFDEISADVQSNGVRSGQAILKHYETLQREGAAVFQWTFKRADTNEPFEAEVHMSTIQVAQSTVTLVMVRDISEQEAAKRELRLVNQQLEARVAQRTAQLQAANAQLRATNRALEEFTGSASHDLRSPLGVISGQAGMLELTYGDQLGEQGRQRLARIQQAVIRASDVVGGLLSLASITRQKLEEESVNLSVIAEGVVAELREAEAGREVDIFIEPDMVVSADPRLMTSLITNLIGNAWKYSSKRPQVWIRFERVDARGELVYCIADRGAGFCMEHAANLFKAFSRLHSSEEFTGVGLGLATVQRIVSRYGGRIWAEAEQDVGAKFFFSLPHAEVREPRAKRVGE